VHEVDAHNCIPPWITSDHIEYAARTIRPKVTSRLHAYVLAADAAFPGLERAVAQAPCGFQAAYKAGVSVIAWSSGSGTGAASTSSTPGASATAAEITALTGCTSFGAGLGIDWHAATASLECDADVGEVTWITPGPAAAKAALEAFVTRRMGRYDGDRNDPTKDAQSGLSPYLHFGQLAPARCVIEAYKYRSKYAKVKSHLIIT
jgi:deoxyribodipyrimidine photo-lyase